MAANGVAVVVKQAISGVPFENVIHMIDAGANTGNDISQAVESAWVGANSFADVVQTAAVKYLGTNVRNIDGVHDGEDFAWSNGIDEGQISDETAPISISLLYSLRTAHPGRTGRGRLYIAGVRHGAFAAEQIKWNLTGSPGDETVGAALAFGAHLTAALGDLTWAVFSRKNNQVYPITNAIAQTLFGEQRRRSGRVTP